MVLLNLNRKCEIPMYKQVISQLMEKIDNKTLKPGDKLPSTRALSKQLGINRTTIYRAYQELWAMGYIQSKSGSYSYVRQRRDFVTTQKNTSVKIINWAKQSNPKAENVYNMFKKISYPFSEDRKKFDGIDFGRLHPDTRIFPINEFKKSISKVMSSKGEMVLDYGECRGYKPLKEHIAHRMRMHNIPVSGNEIIITNGAQNALDLLMRLFVKPDTKVFVESPTYGMIIPTLTYYGFEIVPIPMKENGVDLNYMERELEKERPVFFYTMPNFHNPTGITTTQTHRESLLALCEKYSVPIIEDAYEEEMKYFGKVPMPIKSMDSKQIVIYVGSFSKVLFPGIRLGWISADLECINRLAILKRFGDITSALPEQAALAEFCNNGDYELHIKKLHKIYRHRMTLAIKILHAITKNKNVSWQEPNGGFTMWIELKEVKQSYDELNKLFNKHKIRLALGRDFFAISVKEKYFRIAIASLDDEEITEGLSRLGKALEEIYK